MKATLKRSAITTQPRITYTVFPDLWPTQKTEITGKSWSSLVARIKRPKEYPHKGACPLISLAEYGDAIGGEKKCLRYADNVVRVHGAELDYDAERMSIEEAAKLLQDANIEAVLHTSASHTKDAPRWRVLAPLREPVRLADRAQFVGRLNRVLGGVAGKESFAQSQCFYFGRVKGVEYQVFSTHGRTIDEAPDLEPLHPADKGANGAAGATVTDAELHQAFKIGSGRYQAMLALTSRWAGRGNPEPASIATLRAWLAQSPDVGSAHHAQLVKAVPGLVRSAGEHCGIEVTAAGAIVVTDFYAYMPQHSYIFKPTREMWPASSVNARCTGTVMNTDGAAAMRKVRQEKKDGTVEYKEVPMQPTQWLDMNHAVDQMVWAPGRGMIIDDALVMNGTWTPRAGCRTFNLYMPPKPITGDAHEAGPWIAHLQRIYPADASHIWKWLAHRVQRPHEKINHALVLGGMQGIGKDTLLEPVKRAIGPWNFQDVSPTQLVGRFNSFLKSVILRISEARDLGEANRYGFYEHMKTLCAAPPDVLRCDEKHLREHSVMNVTGVLITTNHKAGGIYLPADDRRHYVAWSPCAKEEFSEDYWLRLYAWYADGGGEHVAAFLAALDLSEFDCKAPPPKTPAFFAIVDANRAPENAELADVIDALGQPPALTLDILARRADVDLRDWLQDRRSRPQLPHRLESVGYVPVRCDTAEDGLWRMQGRRQVIYANKILTIRDQTLAARALVRDAATASKQ